MTSTSPESVGLSSPRLARLADAYARRIERCELSGVATMVARGGKLAHFHVQGKADIQAGRALAEDTIYHVYSMSKPVTAVAILMLMEEGRFQLDDPAADFIPELGRLKVLESMADGKPVLAALKRPVTFRHLLTHTAGFCYPSREGTATERLLAAEMGGDDFREISLTLEQWVKRLVTVPLAFQPGDDWKYSMSIDVLGRLVEAISGTTLDRFFADRIFGPLGMVDTSFAVPDAKLPRLAVVYRDDGRGALEKEEVASRGYGTRPTFFSGGGGLYSTAPDYLRFAQMLKDGGQLGGVRILGRRTVALMRMSHVGHLAHLPGVQSGEFFLPGCTFGLAGRVVADESVGLCGSRGTYSWDGMAGTTFLVDPVEDLVALFFTQISPWPPRLHEQFRTLVYQALV